MAFGWSVSDISTCVQLVNNIISSLRDSDGSASEYQELIRGLEDLARVLQYVDKLQPRTDQPRDLATIQHIKYLALSCMYPLKEFLAEIQILRW
ncbi:MAG: hypothetical protein MMC33_006614 [Icmadophila ericetorum]|nr:hypothetical protein [Icmadophila ericetorum]